MGHRGSSGSGDDNDDGWDGTAPPPDPDERFRPRVDVFDAGLTFVGSVAEASTNRPEPLPPLAASDSGRPQQRKDDDGGWMFTTKGGGNTTVPDSYKRGLSVMARGAQTSAVVACGRIGESEHSTEVS